MGRGLILQHSITIVVINNHIKWKLDLHKYLARRSEGTRPP